MIKEEKINLAQKHVVVGDFDNQQEGRTALFIFL